MRAKTGFASLPRKAAHSPASFARGPAQAIAEKARSLAIGGKPRAGRGFSRCHTSIMDTTHLPRLRARARRLCRSDADAEDLCHDVCLAFLERTARGAQIERPLPYMMTALRHAVQGHLKAAAVLSPLEDEDHPEVADASDACYCAEVLQHVERLPKTDRALLRRVAFEGITPTELAAELGLPIGTVMSRLGRARARLRDMLEPDRS